MQKWIAGAIFFSSLVAFGQEKIEFEVASIKPSAPQPMGQMRIGMSADAGMLRYSNVSLRDCIRIAYRVKEFQVQGPDWVNSERFDIVAKLPSGSTQDQIPEMLQAMLAERFKLTFHRETKEHAIFALVAGKGGAKLKPAEVPLGDGDSAGPGPAKGAPPRNGMMMQVDGAGAHLIAPSATLANLAEMISRFSERPVLDMTEIQGRYDFDLVFSADTMRGGPGGGMHGPGDAHAPSEAPADAPGERAGSIYDSVQRYGLKLEPRKAPMEVLLLDHIEKAPTEN